MTETENKGSHEIKIFRRVPGFSELMSWVLSQKTQMFNLRLVVNNHDTEGLYRKLSIVNSYSFNVTMDNADDPIHVCRN